MIKIYVYIVCISKLAKSVIRIYPEFTGYHDFSVSFLAEDIKFKRLL